MTEVFDEQRPAPGRLAPRKTFLSITPDPASRFAPFPLMEVQKAYWLGRGDYFELGNVGCHIYLELARPGLVHERLEAAWQQLIERHDMLRAVAGPDGSHGPADGGGASPALRELARAAILCNDAALRPPSDDNPQWTAVGDPLEAALIAFAGRCGLDPGAERAAAVRVAEHPFDSWQLRQRPR